MRTLSRAAAIACLGLLVSTVFSLGMHGAVSAAPIDSSPSVRFAAVDILIDSGPAPLAAWQFELTEGSGRMQVVGVEGGEHPAFVSAPYFDREAVAAGTADRIIVAAYSLRPTPQLPSGLTRIATIHLRLQGDTPPDYRIARVTAGNPDGEPIAVTTLVRETEERP